MINMTITKTEQLQHSSQSKPRKINELSSMGKFRTPESHNNGRHHIGLSRSQRLISKGEGTLCVSPTFTHVKKDHVYMSHVSDQSRLTRNKPQSRHIQTSNYVNEHWNPTKYRRQCTRPMDESDISQKCFKNKGSYLTKFFASRDICLNRHHNYSRYIRNQSETSKHACTAVDKSKPSNTHQKTNNLERKDYMLDKINALLRLMERRHSNTEQPDSEPDSTVFYSTREDNSQCMDNNKALLDKIHAFLATEHKEQEQFTYIQTPSVTSQQSNSDIDSRRTFSNNQNNIRSASEHTLLININRLLLSKIESQTKFVNRTSSERYDEMDSGLSSDIELCNSGSTCSCYPDNNVITFPPPVNFLVNEIRHTETERDFAENSSNGFYQDSDTMYSKQACQNPNVLRHYVLPVDVRYISEFPSHSDTCSSTRTSKSSLSLKSKPKISSKNKRKMYPNKQKRLQKVPPINFVTHSASLKNHLGSKFVRVNTTENKTNKKSKKNKSSVKSSKLNVDEENLQTKETEKEKNKEENNSEMQSMIDEENLQEKKKKKHKKKKKDDNSETLSVTNENEQNLQGKKGKKKNKSETQSMGDDNSLSNFSAEYLQGKKKKKSTKEDGSEIKSLADVVNEMVKKKRKPKTAEEWYAERMNDFASDDVTPPEYPGMTNTNTVLENIDGVKTYYVQLEPEHMNNTICSCNRPAMNQSEVPKQSKLLLTKQSNPDQVKRHVNGHIHAFKTIFTDVIYKISQIIQLLISLRGLIILYCALMVCYVNIAIYALIVGTDVNPTNMHQDNHEERPLHPNYRDELSGTQNEKLKIKNIEINLNSAQIIDDVNRDTQIRKNADNLKRKSLTREQADCDMPPLQPSNGNTNIKANKDCLDAQLLKKLDDILKTIQMIYEKQSDKTDKKRKTVNHDNIEPFKSVDNVRKRHDNINSDEQLKRYNADLYTRAAEQYKETGELPMESNVNKHYRREHTLKQQSSQHVSEKQGQHTLKQSSQPVPEKQSQTTDEVKTAPVKCGVLGMFFHKRCSSVIPCQ